MKDAKCYSNSKQDKPQSPWLTAWHSIGYKSPLFHGCNKHELWRFTDLCYILYWSLFYASGVSLSASRPEMWSVCNNILYISVKIISSSQIPISDHKIKQYYRSTDDTNSTVGPSDHIASIWFIKVGLSVISTVKTCDLIRNICTQPSLGCHPWTSSVSNGSGESCDSRNDIMQHS